MSEISPSNSATKKLRKCKPGYGIYIAPSRQMAAKLENLPSAESSPFKVETVQTASSSSSQRPADSKSPSISDDKRPINPEKSNGSVSKNTNGEQSKSENVQKSVKQESAPRKQADFLKNQPREARKPASSRKKSKTREPSSKNIALAKQPPPPPQNHGFENLRSSGRKSSAPKWRQENRQPAASAKRSSPPLNLDDESSSSANNTLQEMILKKGFTVENSNLKTPRADFSTKVVPTAINLPPPPKKFSENVESTRQNLEKLQINDNEITKSANLEKKIILSPIIDPKADVSWPEIMENEVNEQRMLRERSAQVLEGPGVIKISNQMASLFIDDSMKKKSKGRGYVYHDEKVVSDFEQQQQQSVSRYEPLKASGRGKYLQRHAQAYAAPGRRRQDDDDDDDRRHFQPQNLFLQNIVPIPPPSKFSQIQEKPLLNFVDQHLAPIDALVDNMKLLLGSGTGPVDINKLMSIRKVIQEKYEKVVQIDYNANFKYGIERKMWKSAFYDIIELLRSYISEPKSKGLIQLCRETLLNLIDEGIKCYDNLLKRCLSAHDISLQDFLLDFDENLNPQSKIRKTVHDLQSAQKYVLYTCHKFKISLGDLARYKQQAYLDSLRQQSQDPEVYSKVADYSVARKHYSEATQMLPSYGRPYNQLALLAQYMTQRLDTVYYFFRSLSVKHPFLSATESMKCTFDEMKRRIDAHQKILKTDNVDRREVKNTVESHRNEIWIDPENGSEKPWSVFRNNGEEIDADTDEVFNRDSFKDVSSQILFKQFVVYFLALHGMIFGKIDLDKFEELAEYNLKQMREILSRGRSPFTAFSLVQIAFICLFNIEEAGDQANIKDLPKDQCPVRFRYAVKLALSIFGLLIEKLHRLWISSGKDVEFLLGDPLSDILLPPIRVFCSYLSSLQAYECYSNSGYLQPLEKPGFKIELWSYLADLANFWSDHNPHKMNQNGQQSSQDGVRITLPEDDLCFPIKKIAKLFEVKVYHAADEPLQISANKIRLNSMVELLEFWDAQDINIIYLPIRIGDKGFVLVDKEETDDKPNCRRRTIASQSEHDHSSDILDSSDISHDISTETLAFRTNQKDEEAKNALREKEQRTGVVLRVEPIFLAPDTNTFIDHLDRIENLILKSKCFKLRVPLIVVDELKGLTKDFDNDWRVQQSEKSLAFLRRMEDDHSKKSCVVQYITVQGHLLDSLEYSHEDSTANDTTNDDRILSSCVKFLALGNSKQKSVDLSMEPIQLQKSLVLLTGDRNLRVKAISKEVPVRTIGEFCAWVESKPRKR